MCNELPIRQAGSVVRLRPPTQDPDIDYAALVIDLDDDAPESAVAAKPPAAPAGGGALTHGHDHLPWDPLIRALEHIANRHAAWDRAAPPAPRPGHYPTVGAAQGAARAGTAGNATQQGG